MKFCSFDCKHAEAGNAIGGSCRTFDGVYCKKAKKVIPKGSLCVVKDKKT